MKNTPLLFFVLVLFCGSALGQITMSIGSFSAKPGDTVYIPVEVKGFNNIGAISLALEIDSNIIEFLGVVKEPGSGNFTHNFVSESIILGWFNTIPLTIGDGNLVELIFTYKGGLSEIKFNILVCEISDPVGNVLNVEFNNGSITQDNLSVMEDDYERGEFSLPQNYPNPFNPVTTISYTIPTASQVNLAVYSVTGEFILEIVNEFQLSGSYSVLLDASNLTSGIYMCQIRAGKNWKSNKLIVLK